MLGTTFDLYSIGEKILALAGILAVILAFAFIVRVNRKALRYFIAFAILVQVTYMTWRILYTIPTRNPAGFIFGVLLFLAEFFALIQTTTHRLMFMKDYEPVPKTLADLPDLPTVDILIATYNEPVKLLRDTVAAAVSQNYPKEKYKVYICDDGHREEVRRLAEEYGAVWSVRDNNLHAKAGNLNHCLEHYATGELFAVLDVDMIPKTGFLEKMVGYFEDPKMALVQAPQVFYNPDPFQNNLQLFDEIPNEQDFFMREVLTRRALFNAVLNVGSNAVFRRSAIESIGRIPVGTITEDMATSMLLQAKGFHTTFVNETLAMGLSPDSFSDYVVQRDRWCRGNIQVFKKWNPLTLPGLSFMQRLIYFDGVLYWFFGLQKLIYYIGPILFLLSGIAVYYSDVFTMLLFFAPAYYISSLVFTLFRHKSRTYVWAHIYETALAPYLSISAVSELLFAKKVKFSVTPKGKAADRTHFAARVAWPHLVFIAISLFAMGVGIQKMLTDVNYMVPVYLVNLFWLLYNLLGLITAVIVCFEKQRVRAVERFSLHDKITLTLANGKAVVAELIDISMLGCAVSPVQPFENADQWTGSELLLQLSGSSVILPGTFFRSRSWGKKLIINFRELSTLQHTNLVNFIFDHQQNGYGSFNKKSINFNSAFSEIVYKFLKGIKTMKNSLMIFIPVIIMASMLLAQCSPAPAPATVSTETPSAPPTNTPTLPPAATPTSAATETPEKPKFPLIRGINVGNALEAPQPGAWGVTINPEYFGIIQAAGFNSVRIPACFSCHSDKNAPYIIDPAFFKEVDNAVNPALKAGLIVFLDVHHFGEIMQDPAGQRDRFFAIWRQVAEHYKDAGPSLYFELLNEPNQNMSAAAWKSLSLDALKIIRGITPDRTITLSGVEYGSAWSLRNLTMPSADNTAAIFHYYEPFKFTHQGAMWMQGSNDWIGTKWTGTPEEIKIVTDTLDLVAEWSKTSGVPVVMNEFGSINTADPDSRQRWTEYLTREAEKRGIGWMYWEFCAGFGVFDSKTMKWDQKMLKALIPETPAE